MADNSAPLFSSAPTIIEGCAHCLVVIPESLMADADEGICARCGYVTRRLQRTAPEDNDVFLCEPTGAV